MRLTALRCTPEPCSADAFFSSFCIVFFCRAEPRILLYIRWLSSACPFLREVTHFVRG